MDRSSHELSEFLDEFDALPEAAISGIAGVFRNIYTSRRDAAERTTEQKDFLYFARELVADTGRLYAPFEDVYAVITAERVHVVNLLRRFERYLQENRDWLLKDAPRKSNPSTSLRAEALKAEGSGQALLIAYSGRVYGLEVKSFTNRSAELTAKPAGLPAQPAPGRGLWPAVGACPERSRRAGRGDVGALRGAGGRRQPDEVRGSLHGRRDRRHGGAGVREAGK
jgi:hypothetical protein